MKQFEKASRVNFNPTKRMQRFKDWQADLMARERGISRLRREPIYDKATMRAMCDCVYGPVMKGETLKAHGAYEGPRGGVVPAASR